MNGLRSEADEQRDRASIRDFNVKNSQLSQDVDQKSDLIRIIAQAEMIKVLERPLLDKDNQHAKCLAGEDRAIKGRIARI